MPSLIKKIHQDLVDKKVSAAELVERTIKIIEQKDNSVGAFLTVIKESAVSQAKRVDDEIGGGGKIDWLAGIPYGVKDVIMVEGERATAASKILEPYVASYDATAIARLKDKGAICVGKTNLDEFAHGASTEHSALKKTANPRDLSRVPGGSSGGSAAAVAAQMVPFALGTDTGGSVRQPAAFCGVVGYKPTYGRVSRFGLMAMASSIDQIGPLTESAEDAAIVLDAISGEDSFDTTSLAGKFEYKEADFMAASLEKFAKNLKMGIVKEFTASLSPAARKSFDSAISRLESLGAQIKEVFLPLSQAAVNIYYILMPAEVSSNLARYDGMRYGLSESGQSPYEVYTATRGAGFGAESQRRVLLGTFVLSAGYFDAYYGRAKAGQQELKKEYTALFGDVNILLSPTAPTPAFKFGEKDQNPVDMYLADIFTVTANLVGAPAISVPGEKVDGLPFGIQFMGRPGDDLTVLKAAAAFDVK